MTTIHQVLDQLRRTVRRGDVAALSDGQLLERYITQQDETAFEALLCRHGPMVLGVCRRILRNPADAEDAFQASFLVLVRRARSVSPRDMVGNWLYGVACHTALKARELAERRRGRERAAGLDRPAPSDGLGELRELLDAGLRSLPERYRAAVVLCDLEGKSRKEVAGQLGWAEGTVASRLSRGRDLLARRLRRGGLALSAGALGALLAEGAALARVPAPLTYSTAHAAAAYAAGGAALGGVPGTVVALTEGVLRAMWMTKLKVAAAVVLGVSLVTAGAGHLSIATGQGPSGPPATKTAATGRANPAVPALIQALKDPSPEVRASAASILARLGTDAREAIPALVAVLKDNDSKVRAQAVEALGALAREKEKPAEPAPDIIFIRRTHLDATGTPPTPAEVQKFLADTSPDKRAKLVDSLLRPNHEWLDFGGIGDEQRLLFAPNGETLAIARRHEVTLVNARTGEEKRSLSVPDRIASAAFSPDARLLVIASSNHKVRAYDANTGKLVWQREAPATDRPSGR